MTHRTRSLIHASLITVMAAGLTGCPDPNARSEAEASVALNGALESLDRAGQGFVPRARTEIYFTEEGGDSFAELARQYRQENLAEAVTRLEAVVEKGTPQARIGALRLLADIKAAQARALTSQAMIDYSKLSNRGANMVTQALLIAQAEARGEMFQNDEQYLREDLAEQRSVIQDRISALEEEGRALQQRIDDLQSRIATLEEQRSAATTRAEEQSAAAFTQVGEAQYQSSLQAIESQREADAAAAQAELLAVELEVEQSRLAVVQREIEMLQANSEQIEEELRGVQQREDERVAQLSGAGEAAQANEATLRRLFSASAQEQASLVDARFEQAIELLQESVAHLEQAKQIAVSSDAVQAINMDLLGTLVGLTRAQYQYAMVTGGYGETLNAVIGFYTGSIASRENLEVFQSEAERVGQKQAALLQEIRDTIAQGISVANDLSGSNLSDSAAAIVTEHAERLNIYEGRLDPVTIGSTATFPEEVYSTPQRAPEPMLEPEEEAGPDDASDPGFTDDSQALPTGEAGGTDNGGNGGNEGVGDDLGDDQTGDEGVFTDPGINPNQVDEPVDE